MVQNSDGQSYMAISGKDPTIPSHRRLGEILWATSAEVRMRIHWAFVAFGDLLSWSQTVPLGSGLSQSFGV